MTWQPCDFYRCSNAECKSRVLVLESPRATSGPFAPPRCVCGHLLERMPYGPEEPLRTWSF
jgi:hypothetical protein